MSDDSTKQHLFALMAHAEEQQKNIDQTIHIINKQQAQIESCINNYPTLRSSYLRTLAMVLERP